MSKSQIRVEETSKPTNDTNIIYKGLRASCSLGYLRPALFTSSRRERVGLHRLRRCTKHPVTLRRTRAVGLQIAEVELGKNPDRKRVK